MSSYITVFLLVYLLFLVRFMTNLKNRDATGGGAQGVRAPPAFHTLTKNMFLNRGGTHFTPGLRLCIISSSYYKYTCAPLSNYPVRPLLKNIAIQETMTNT